MPSHNIEVGVCCNVSVTTITGPTFFFFFFGDNKFRKMPVFESVSDEYKYRFFQEGGVLGQYMVFGWWNFQTVG